MKIKLSVECADEDDELETELDLLGIPAVGDDLVWGDAGEFCQARVVAREFYASDILADRGHSPFVVLRAKWIDERTDEVID